jgi:hypothetical protein
LLFVGSLHIEVFDITSFFNTKITNSYLEGNITGFELDTDLNNLLAISDSKNKSSNFILWKYMDDLLISNQSNIYTFSYHTFKINFF